MEQSLTRRDAWLAIGLVIGLLGASALALGPLRFGTPGPRPAETGEVVRLVASARAHAGDGDHALRQAASREPAIAAIAVLDRSGARHAPASWEMPTYPEQLLLNRLQASALPPMGATTWIGAPSADSDLATACYGGASDVTCLLLRSDILLATTPPAPRRPFLIGLGLLGAIAAAFLLRPAKPRYRPGALPAGHFVMADLHIDPTALRAWRPGAPARIDLSRRELRLLEMLHRHPGQALSRDRLFDEVWGRDYMPNSRALDQFVSKLRRKIEARADRPRIVQTVRGVGYRFDPEPF